jgi:hypothetical protein
MQPRSGRAAPPFRSGCRTSRSAPRQRCQRPASNRHRRGGAGERSCWPRWIHPKDRGDASDRTDHQRGGAAESLVDPLGDQDPVGGPTASGRTLIPGHHLGANRPGGRARSGPAIRQAVRWRALAARWAWCGLARANRRWTIIKLVPILLRTTSNALWVGDPSPPRNGIPHLSVWYAERLPSY